MPFDSLSKLAAASKAAGGAAYTSISKKWGKRRDRNVPGVIDDKRAEEIRLRNEFLNLITSKLTGDSVSEMAPLVHDDNTNHRAVFLVTEPITFGKFELSEKTYSLLAKHIGMSLDSVSHWAVCVIDRGLEPCYCYDLMSDRLEFYALGKNYFRVNEITPEFVQTWSSCYYVGETTKTHTEIQQLGLAHMALNPNYRLLSNNCQHLVDSLVKELCNGKVISQAKLEEELSLASPKIARDLIVAKFRSRKEAKKLKEENEDSDSETIKDFFENWKKKGWRDGRSSKDGSE
ncbi:hypothetical protein EDB81DRAFT_877650 [Dactylonectria macrodidyma]|uniref:PPPDE domain-containing protein n=1 Tax=Dactylonectria macrodidyma TaxID=307937 RepID=A0A9P9JJB6_9HYPO|nr:hypothetical protein EDB81DRAFT_877650 [Dactylonectria macrodidyma]